MLGALAIALRATARALPLQSDIDALELEVELRFRNVPGILNSEQSSQQFGVAHALPIPKDRHFPSPHPLQVPMRQHYYRRANGKHSRRWLVRCKLESC